MLLVHRPIPSLDGTHLLGMAEGVRERGVDLGDRDIVARGDLLRRVVSFDVALVDVIHADAVALDSRVSTERLRPKRQALSLVAREVTESRVAL
jgi:hypothetical protein